MTIEEFKNQMEETAKEFFTTTAKDAIVEGLRDTVIPALKEVAEPFTAQLKEDAQTETGWVKFRDGVFLPGLISLTFWAADKLLGEMATEAAVTEGTAETTGTDAAQEPAQA
nr:prevent-host-death protein [Mitsuokella multacida]